MAAARLRGRVVAVTGAGRGIGLATATKLVGQDALVALGDLDGDLAEAAALRLGPAARGFSLDVTDRDSFASFLASTESELGPLYGLVNNAGMMPLGRFTDEPDANTAAVVAVNLEGVVIGMKLALPGLIERGEGHIVNVASLAGKLALPGAATYTAAKHGVIGLTKAVRAELRGSGVGITVVMPAVVRTELSSGVRTGPLRPISPDRVAAAIVRSIGSRGGEVCVPRYLRPLVWAEASMPDRAVELVRRLVRDDRGLTEVDAAGRDAYERRVSSVVSRNDR